MNAIMQNFDKIFNASLIYATFRSATPIIFAALCAAITQQANILNIGTEGIMLVGAFTAVAVSYFTGSWLLGIIAAMIAGAVIAMIMAVGHIRYNSEICAIGMGINLLALALTKFMVNAIFHSTGSFSSPDIKAIPRVSLGFLDNLPVVGDLFNNWCVTEWFAIVLIILLQFFFYKTVWGLRLRAVGQFPEAAKTAGIKVNAIKYQAMLLSGLIGGLAGAHLSLGYSTQSSYPTTETSSGTFFLYSLSFLHTPYAEASLQAKIAVKSCEMSFSTAAAPPSCVYSPAQTRRSSTGIPASSIARQ